MRISLVVEGHGDVAALPILVGKIGAAVGLPLYPIRAIRSGGWSRLNRAGELERFVELALSHSPDRVLVVSDLEDHCPKEQRIAFDERVNTVLSGRNVPVEVAFCVKEFEAWLLSIANVLSVRAGHGLWDLSKVPVNPETVRGAKEALSRVMKTRYKETIHQARLSSAIDVAELFSKCRSFRRMVTAASGLTYEKLGNLR